MDGVNNRGTKKWTDMMMPEHVEKLKEVLVSYENRVSPGIDAQQKERFFSSIS